MGIAQRFHKLKVFRSLARRKVLLIVCRMARDALESEESEVGSISIIFLRISPPNFEVYTM